MVSRFLHPDCDRNRAASRPYLPLALEFLLYAFLAAFALHATWLTWPDAYVDFSRELYLPWRVACGDLLYRDLAYDFGPLSVYLDAVLFALLGRPSVHALFALDFAFWIAILLALRALLRRIARPAVATLAVSLFILLFSFNRYGASGGFNFLAPYSHELPRGLLLALLSLLALDSALGKSSRGRFWLAGFLLCLSLFTKPEIALAAVAASLAFLLAHFRGERGRPPHTGVAPETKPPSLSPRNSSFFALPLFLHAVGAVCAAGMVLLPLSIAFGSFVPALRHALLDLYFGCFNPKLAALPYYRGLAGMDAPVRNVFRLFLGGAVAASPLFVASLALPRLPSRALRLAVTAGFAAAVAALAFFAFDFLNAALPLAPVFFAMATLRKSAPLGNAAACRASPGRGRPAHDGALEPAPPSGTRNPEPGFRPRRPLALAFAAFSFLLIAKMLLAAHVWHYGFVLALPSFCCAVLLAFRLPCPLPRAVVSTALLAGFAAAALHTQADVFRSRDIRHPVHDGAFLAAAHEAEAFNDALAWIRANTPPGSTLAVLPEGAVLNVLSGRPNPTPYVFLDHPAWARFDENAVLDAYSNSPPDALVLVRKPQQAEFGVDYAQSLMDLLNPLYDPVYAYALSSPSGPVPYLLVALRNPGNPPVSSPVANPACP